MVDPMARKKRDYFWWHPASRAKGYWVHDCLDTHKRIVLRDAAGKTLSDADQESEAKEAYTRLVLTGGGVAIEKKKRAKKITLRDAASDAGKRPKVCELMQNGLLDNDTGPARDWPIEISCLKPFADALHELVKRIPLSLHYLRE